MAKRRSLASRKVEANMKEMQAGTLHSGSKDGPPVTNPKQAIAIGLSEARKLEGQPAGPRRKPMQGLPIR